MQTEHTPLWRRTGIRIAAVAIAVPALALAWYLGSPLFLDKTVTEAFPVVTAAPAVDAVAADEPTAAPAEAPAAGTDESPAGAAAGDAAADAGPASTSEPGSSTDQAATGTEDATDGPPTGPVVLFSGEFQDADDRHRGSGTATIYELEDGSRILRFENLDVTNGPDLHVILSPTGSVETRDDVMAPGYVDLGELKGNKGDQNYEIPLDVDLSGDVTIVIYCQPFHVVFSTASLASA